MPTAHGEAGVGQSQSNEQDHPVYSLRQERARTTSTMPVGIECIKKARDGSPKPIALTENVEGEQC